MRQKQREITDEDELLEIMQKCDVCRLAFNHADGYPYILPVNFGIGRRAGKLCLYLHSALEGEKVAVMKKDSRVSFEMDREHRLQYFPEQGYCTMSYESVIGRGRIQILADEEKEAALEILMDHYHPGKHAYFNPAAVPRTLVYALTVEEMTGKRKSIKKFSPISQISCIDNAAITVLICACIVLENGIIYDIYDLFSETSTA